MDQSAVSESLARRAPRAAQETAQEQGGYGQTQPVREVAAEMRQRAEAERAKASWQKAGARSAVGQKFYESMMVNPNTQGWGQQVVRKLQVLVRRRKTGSETGIIKYIVIIDY